MDFSVIGDSVNLASRIETLNRELGTRILISEDTYQAVKDYVHTRGPRPVAIRGKEDVVNVYELLDWINPEDAKELVASGAEARL
jgi:adenylate cyclase